MDPRIALLKEFSKSFILDRVKIEAEQFGFPFLEWLLSDGTLDYGQLTDTGALHKYRLANVSERRMDELLQLHLSGQLNVCRYFGTEKNELLCFNIDNNYRTDNTAIIPQLSEALDTLRTCLADLGCEPLIVASGRGYHVWVRANEPVENTILYDFMVATAARALLPLMVRGDNHRVVKFSFYPDVNIVDEVSLRLFGTQHAKTKAFSHVVTPEGLLDVDASWQRFDAFVHGSATPAAMIRAALEKLRIPEGTAKSADA